MLHRDGPYGRGEYIVAALVVLASAVLTITTLVLLAKPA